MRYEIKIPKSILEDFVIDYCSSNDDVLVLRTNTINTDKEAYDFVKMFGNLTGCQYILNFTNPNPTRIVYHTSWICRFSKRNKMPGSKNNKNCEATLSYKIKKLSHSEFTDPFMSEIPPKPGVMQIRLIHSHRLNPPENIDFMIWSQELKKPVEEPSEDGSSSIESTAIKEEIDSDCEMTESELPDIYQLPPARKQYHPHTRIGRPPLSAHLTKNSCEFSNSMTCKSEHVSQILPDGLSSERSPQVPVPIRPAPVANSTETNKSEPTTDQPPKVNVFIFQVKPGTPLMPNFEVKPATTTQMTDLVVKPETIPLSTNYEAKSGPPIIPHFEKNTLPFGQNTTVIQQNALPHGFIFNPSQGVTTISTDKGKIPQLLFTNPSDVVQRNVINSDPSFPYPVFMSNTNTSSNTPKNDEFILPVISTISSQKTNECINVSTASNNPDPKSASQTEISHPPVTDGSENKEPTKLQPDDNESFAKPIRNPKFEDLEMYKNLSNEPQDTIEIDGDEYIPKEVDSLDIYGLHVAERLRKLDQKTREFVQKSIDGVLFDAEIGLGDFTYEKSQCIESSVDSLSTCDENSDTFDSESTWSAYSDQE